MTERAKTVLVVGGGAAGMMAALAAAGRGAQVTVLERMDKPGKKILLAGNGRCNITNTRQDLFRYHGAPSSFTETVLKSFSLAKTLDTPTFLEILIHYLVGVRGFRIIPVVPIHFLVQMRVLQILQHGEL